MNGREEVWLPLVDEPIGDIVKQIEAEHPDLLARVALPQRLLAFRTFAYIRVGVVLGELLVERDVQAAPASGAWVEELLRDPACRRRVVEAVKAVAEEVAADPGIPGEPPVVPDEAARERFRRFARERLRSP